MAVTESTRTFLRRVARRRASTAEKRLRELQDAVVAHLEGGSTATYDALVLALYCGGYTHRKEQVIR